MRSFRKELTMNVSGRNGFVNITPMVEDCLRQSRVREGLLLVNAMQMTSSVFIEKDDRGLHQDYTGWLEGLAPREPINRYRHNIIGEPNGDAHLKGRIMGREVVVAVTNGHLDCDPKEKIFYGEFDGGLQKGVLVKIIGE